MPTPNQLQRAVTAFGDAYRAAELAVNGELADILDAPNEGNRRRRLRSLAAEIDRRSGDLEGEARAFLNNSLPSAWSTGATKANVGAFTWTQGHRQAIGMLAQDTFRQVLGPTRHMSRDVKTLIRGAGREEARLKVITGKTAVQAGRDLTARLRYTGITAVTYKDGRNIRASTYAEMLMRTKTAAAYNLGGLNQMAGAGIRYCEVIDGGDCGLVTHDDGLKPNGRVFPVEVMAAYPSSHPNCRRDLAPRPDITSDDEAAVASSWRSDEQIADQVSFEKYLREKAARRTTTGRAPRVARTSRTTRAPRKTTTARPTAKTAAPRPPVKAVAKKAAPAPPRTTVDPWKSAKTTAEAEQQLRNMVGQIDAVHGIKNKFERPFSVDLGATKPSDANVLAKEIRDFLDQNPGTRRTFNGIVVTDDLHTTVKGAVATADRTNGIIRLSPESTDAAANISQSELLRRREWWSSSSGTHVVSHELGHMLDYAATEASVASRGMVITGAVNRATGINPWDLQQTLMQRRHNDLPLRLAIQTRLSEYGATNSFEISAESVAEVRGMGDAARPLARDIYDGLRRLSMKWVGK